MATMARIIKRMTPVSLRQGRGALRLMARSMTKAKKRNALMTELALNLSKKASPRLRRSLFFGMDEWRVGKNRVKRYGRKAAQLPGFRRARRVRHGVLGLGAVGYGAYRYRKKK